MKESLETLLQVYNTLPIEQQGVYNYVRSGLVLFKLTETGDVPNNEWFEKILKPFFIDGIGEIESEVNAMCENMKMIFSVWDHALTRVRNSDPDYIDLETTKNKNLLSMILYRVYANDLKD